MHARLLNNTARCRQEVQSHQLVDSNQVRPPDYGGVTCFDCLDACRKLADAKQLRRDRHFMNVATVVSKLGTCSKLQVGAIIARGDEQIAAGYNGAPRGLPHCSDDNHVGPHCDNAVHAELNAIIHAARRGPSVLGATLYTTAMPCWPCARATINAGLVRVVYGAEYKPDDRVVSAFQSLKIEFIHLS
jgi:dCMP deaminase